MAANAVCKTAVDSRVGEIRLPQHSVRLSHEPQGSVPFKLFYVA